MLARSIPPFIRPASADRPFLFAVADIEFDGRREREVVRDLRRGGPTSLPLLDGRDGEEGSFGSMTVVLPGSFWLFRRSGRSFLDRPLLS